MVKKKAKKISGRHFAQNRERYLSEAQAIIEDIDQDEDKMPVISGLSELKLRPGVGGRPTKFRKEMGEEYFDYCKLGLTKAQICAMWGISRETLRDWSHKKPIFSAAVQQGDAVRLAIFEQVTLKLASHGKQTGGMQFFINNLDKSYADTKNINIAGADGGPLKIEHGRLEDKTEEELEDIIAKRLGKGK